MKNKLYYLAAVILALSSCGTESRYSSASYEDPAYYRPGTDIAVIRKSDDQSATDKELQALKEKTKEVIVVDEKSGKTVLPLSKADTVLVDINEYDSYEELLTKFNSPEYEIHFNVTNDFDWWCYPWAWNYPYYYWNPSWRFAFRYYGYWDPWYYSSWYWHNPYYYDYWWYIDPYYGWWGPRYDLYGYWPSGGWYSGVYWGVPVERHLYGRRDSDHSNPNQRHIGINSSGSYTRMSKAEISQIRGSNVSTANSNGNRLSQSVYRRENSQGRFTSGTTFNNVSKSETSNSNITRNNNSGNVGGSTGAYQRSSNSGIKSNTTSAKQSEYTRSTGNYRAPSRQTNAVSGSNKNSGISTGSNTSTNRSEFQRSNTNNTYSQPTRSSGVNQSSGSSNQSSQSSGSGRSSSGSGSTYRR